MSWPETSRVFEADSPLVDCVRPAVNFGERARDTAIEILLLHYTGMENGQGAEDWLCCAESGVSCHYIVHEDGRIVQMVPEAARAHHAGEGVWEGRGDINSRSIGIEIVNDGHKPDAALPSFLLEQMEAVAALSADIVARHGISAHRVLGHSDTAPGRKIDPGEAFDWEWLAGHGVGVRPPDTGTGGGRYFQRGDSGEPVEALQAMLALFGYGIHVTGTFDAATEIVVTAFQRHFRRSLVDGVADAPTISALHILLRERDRTDFPTVRG